MANGVPGQPGQVEYDTWQRVTRLRREVLVGDEVDPRAVEELAEAEQKHVVAVAARRSEQARVVAPAARLLGAESTGLEANAQLAVSHVPTAICHLLDAPKHPLVRCVVSNTTDSDAIRRLRVSCWVDGYSAPATDTVELKRKEVHKFNLMPTFYPDRLRSVTELTRATVVVKVDDLDGRVEIHRTLPVWLLARTTAALSVYDPSSGNRVDLSPYLGAFVTPNALSIMAFLRSVAKHHPDGQLVGYQVGKHVVEPQVSAAFSALKQDADITYVNSVIAFSPEDGGTRQRVRLPRESLEDKQANCLDGTVLVASLLEAMSLRPAIVIIPGHAFVGWETWPYSDEWRYLETTVIGSHDFAAAEQIATAYATQFKAKAKAIGDDALFRQWPLAELRTEWGITPME